MSNKPKQEKPDLTLAAVWLFAALAAFFFAMWVGGLTEPDLIEYDQQQLQTRR